VLPGVVPAELLLAQSDKAAVCVTRLAAYPSGFSFDLLSIGKNHDDALDPMLFGPHHHRAHLRGADLPPEFLRLGIQFSDGRKATNTSGFHDGGDCPDVVMHGGGGGGGGGSWHQEMWVWPLPPAGTLTFVCEWPQAEIELTRHELDAQPILDAASRARVIFPQEDLPDQPGGGGTASPYAEP
jgi:hypothetical protein